MTADGSEKNGSAKNPWELIPLSDYENHMRLGSVRQLQALDQMMKGQLEDFSVSSVMILGVAGGNGLEHIKRDKFDRVYGVDVNADYLKETAQRYPDLEGALECICADLTREAHKLPETELIIADLLIEYIGYECFKKVIEQTKPKYASCIIQINTDSGGWVSGSPYLHVLSGWSGCIFRLMKRPWKAQWPKSGIMLREIIRNMLCPMGKSWLGRILRNNRRVNKGAAYTLISLL